MAPILALVPGLATGLLVGVCATAVALDVSRARLPNWLTLGALLVALGLRAPGGWETVGLGMVSAALALAFGFPFYLLGGLGGGDVKLMAGLAAFLDPRALVTALLVMALTGGAMTLIAAARRRALGQLVRNFGTLLLSIFILGREAFSGWREQEATGPGAASGPDPITNPFGVAIAAGALAGWFL